MSLQYLVVVRELADIENTPLRPFGGILLYFGRGNSNQYLGAPQCTAGGAVLVIITSAEIVLQYCNSCSSTYPVILYIGIYRVFFY